MWGSTRLDHCRPPITWRRHDATKRAESAEGSNHSCEMWERHGRGRGQDQGRKGGGGHHRWIGEEVEAQAGRSGHCGHQIDRGAHREVVRSKPRRWPAYRRGAYLLVSREALVVVPTHI